MTVVEAPDDGSGARAFDLTFDQPVDHQHPEGPHFTQRMYLVHRSADAPFVLTSTGYMLFGSRSSEPAALLNANELVVEHRFFASSIPAEPDWSKLGIVQAAADHHRIVAALKPLYRGKWLSTGASKGGMTSIYHRRFYPDDVDATVAYVAPNSSGRNDPRYNAFLDSVGDDACRERFIAFQREVLLRRPEMEQRILAMETSGTSFQRLGPAMALEHGVIEARFAFWQYGDASDCAAIPETAASDDELFGFLDAVTSFAFLCSDDSIVAFQPYYYQAATELGYPAPAEAALADLLQFPGTDIAETYSPEGVALPFDDAVMPDIARWVASEGERLMFIYGENDPWTAGAFELGDADDSFVFTAQGGNHGASISALSPEAMGQALDALARWTGVTPAPPVRLAPPADLREKFQQARFRR